MKLVVYLVGILLAISYAAGDLGKTIQDEKFPISIKTLTGTRYHMTVSSVTMTDKLKEFINAKTGTAPSEQRLFYAGKELKDKLPLSAYRVIPHAVIHLVVTRKPIPTSFVSVGQAVAQPAGSLDRRSGYSPDPPTGVDPPPIRPIGNAPTLTISSSKNEVIVNSTAMVTKHRKANTKGEVNELVPIFCEFENLSTKECAAWSLPALLNVPSMEQCMRHCVADKECDRCSYDKGLKQCAISKRSGGLRRTCVIYKNGRNLRQSSGTLFYRLLADDNGECPVGAKKKTSPPETDYVSGHFCKIAGKIMDISGAFRSDAKATLFQCKAHCNAYASCAAAVWVRKIQPGEKRMCYLLPKKNYATLTDESEFEGTSGVTMWKLTRGDFQKRNATPENPGAVCPPTTEHYNKEKTIYEDKYCVAKVKGVCPQKTGYMYARPQKFGDGSANACMDKCTGYRTCGLVEFNESKFKSGDLNAAWACNMKDRAICAPDELISPPNGDVIETRFRLKPDDKGACPMGSRERLDQLQQQADLEQTLSESK